MYAYALSNVGYFADSSSELKRVCQSLSAISPISIRLNLVLACHCAMGLTSNANEIFQQIWSLQAYQDEAFSDELFAVGLFTACCRKSLSDKEDILEILTMKPCSDAYLKMLFELARSNGPHPVIVYLYLYKVGYFHLVYSVENKELILQLVEYLNSMVTKDSIHEKIRKFLLAVILVYAGVQKSRVQFLDLEPAIHAQSLLEDFGKLELVPAEWVKFERAQAMMVTGDSGYKDILTASDKKEELQTHVEPEMLSRTMKLPSFLRRMDESLPTAPIVESLAIDLGSMYEQPVLTDLQIRVKNIQNI